MEMNFKRITGLVYIVAGFVWCILNLPNLMARAKGSVVLATALGVIRIIFWPVFVTLLAKNGKSDVELTEGDSDGKTTSTTD